MKLVKYKSELVRKMENIRFFTPCKVKQMLQALIALSLDIYALLLHCAFNVFLLKVHKRNIHSYNVSKWPHYDDTLVFFAICLVLLFFVNKSMKLDFQIVKF